jgi:hypothetical protein
VSPLSRLALALLVSTLAACGGKSSATPGDGGEGGTGTGGTGGTGHAGTGGADACTSFDDDYGTSVGVSISNQTMVPIYLGQDMVTCGVSPLFEVADARGAVLPNLGGCRSPCASLRQGGPAGCLDICAFPTAVALQPNEVLYTTWDGLFSVQAQLPARCASFETGVGAQVSCDQAKRIEPGTFTFSARAGSAIDCSQTTGSGTCDACSASPNGGCSTPGSLITGAMHSAQATILLNENYGVYPAPSTSPGSNTGAADPAPGANIALLTVELVFTE